MECIWINVYTKMLSLLPLHSVLFQPFSTKSAWNQMYIHVAGWLRKSHFVFRKWLRKNTWAVSVGSWVRINQTQNWSCFISNLTNPITKMFTTLIYLKRLTFLSFKIIIVDTDWCQEWNIKSSLLKICENQHAALLLVLFFAPRGFSLVTLVFPFPQKPTFPNSNSSLETVPN